MDQDKWTVRIIIHEDDRNASRDMWWLGEVLRYAGHSRVVGPASGTRSEIFELYPPHGHTDGGRIWADQNAARLRSFGVDAAAAPKWGG